MQHCDILADITEVKEAVGYSGDGFEICLDKGTFDAIALCPDDALAKRAKYIDNVACLVKEQGGKLIITSCNFTENELAKHFQESEFDYDYYRNDKCNSYICSFFSRV